MYLKKEFCGFDVMEAQKGLKSQLSCVMADLICLLFKRVQELV